MGYIYDSLVASLGGNKLTTSVKDNSTISSWSPNMYKRVIILEDGILVDWHSKEKGRYRVLPLDVSKVVADYTSGTKYKNPLKVFTDFRAFSCLEEIIISSTLANEANLLSLINSIPSTHRLRSVGISNLRGIVLFKQALDTLESTGRSLDLISTSIQGIRYKYIEGHEDYYSRYHLRPATYTMDKEGGALDKYFRGIETELSQSNQSKNELNAVKAIVNEDLKHLEFYSNAIKVVSKNSSTEKPRLKSFVTALRNNLIAHNMSYVEGIKLVPKSSAMYPIYQSLGYLKVEGGTKVKSYKGYLPSIDILERALQPQITNLLSSKEVDGLSVPKGSKPLVHLVSALKGGVTETKEAPKPKGANPDEVLKFIEVFSDSMAADLLEVVTYLSNERTAIVKAHLAWREGLPKFSSKLLRESGLVRQEEVLSLLGYVGGSEPLARVVEVPIQEGVLALCRDSSSSLQESMASPWDSMSFSQRCSFILERM